MNKKDQYCEIHHIVPRSFGGSDDNSNLVNLTAREHFIAHKLLFNVCRLKYGLQSGQFRKMALALYFMTHHDRYKDCKMNSRMYTLVKEASVMTGSKNPMWGVNVRTLMTQEAIEEMDRKRSQSLLGHFTSDETKQKISKKNFGSKNGMYGRKVLSGKKCMLNLKSQKYEYVDANLVDEFLKNGYILQGSNHGKKKKTTVDNNVAFYKSHLYKGKLLMIDDSGKEVYVDKGDLTEIKKCGIMGYKFVNKRYNYLLKELINEV